MYGTILTFIKLNNFDTQHLNGPRYLFPSFCCTTWRIFEPLCVYEPGFSMDKYGMLILPTVLVRSSSLICGYNTGIDDKRIVTSCIT